MATTFMGKELVNLRPGNVWALEIYPGGRKTVMQTKAKYVDYTDDAVKKLNAGQRVFVWLDDATEVLRRVNLPTVRT